jgi:tetratricopeptide (TPR) repeat protein
MITSRSLLVVLSAGVVAASAMAQQAEEEESKSPRRRLFGLFKREEKKEEPPKPKEAPKPKEEEPKKSEGQKQTPAKTAKPEEKQTPSEPDPNPTKPVAEPVPEKRQEPAAPSPVVPPKPDMKEAAEEKPETAKPQEMPPTPPKSATEPPPEPKSMPEAAPQPAPPAPAKQAAPPATEVIQKSSAPPTFAPSSPTVDKKGGAMEQIRSSIQAAAKQVERVRKRRGQEVGDLVERVESLLSKPEKLPERREFREERILQALRRPTAPFQFGSRIYTRGRGYLFDDSPDGRQAVIEELYQVKVEGPREVERLLHLSDLWARQRRPDEATAMAQRAVLLARELIKAKPNDATAHGLLAEGLSLVGDEARPEMLMEVEAALKLDPENARALMVKLTDESERLREHLLREGPRRLELPKRDAKEVLRRLHAQPPGPDASAAHAAAAAELKRLAGRVMDRAAGRPDLMLRAAAAMLAPVLDQQIAELARMHKSRSFEHFQTLAAEMETNGALERMEQSNWSDMMRRVMEAASGDAQMIAVVSGLPALWVAAGLDPQGKGGVWSKIPEKYRQMFEKGMDRVAQLAREDSAAAAKACEAVACFEMAAAVLGAKVRHEGMALRAITLDPWRIHAIDLVGASCANGFANGAFALMLLRESVLGGYSSQHRCAAAAVLAQDWSAAERYLQSCLLLRPSSLEVLNHLIAVRLLAEQTPERYAEIESRFQRARAVLAEQDESLPLEVKEAFITNYIVFLCLKQDHQSAAGVFAISVSSGKMGDRTARELAQLIQSAP